ncbi:MAG: hypothetical protein ACI841_003245 [Planctomycetota bacterium]|jgi:hypothetical protein
MFVVLALYGHILHVGPARWSFFLIAPLFVGSAAWLFYLGYFWSHGLWRNQPRLIRAYGPTLAIAIVDAFVQYTQGRACLMTSRLSSVTLNSISIAKGSSAAGSYRALNSR